MRDEPEEDRETIKRTTVVLGALCVFKKKKEKEKRGKKKKEGESRIRKGK